MIHGAWGILIKNKKVLLIKRGDFARSFCGCWGLPNGKCEEGETPEQTVIREVKEEVGLDFVPWDLFQMSVISWSGWGQHESYRFLGEYSGNIVVQESEVDGFAWYTYEEAMELRLAFDYRETLTLLQERGYL